ncbi:MAG TPA: hypothetical protein VN328_03195 [Thermodesulfovibrionales bacterium]|nr:hypothetical protein [Thermodesulfovibrionales bacterium]
MKYRPNRQPFLRCLSCLSTILSIFLLSPFDVHAWSSVKESAGSPGTHHGISREALRMLRDDPAFKGIQFPSLEQMIEESSVNVSALGSGPGPDDATKSAYSMHYYNPSINRGGAPQAILAHYNALKMDIYHASVRSGDAGLAKKASWLAHFIQDMTVPYHVLGMTSTYKVNSQNIHLITGPRIPQVLFSELLQRFQADRTKRGGNADWFEAWYYDGDSVAPTETGTHFAYEALAMNTLPTLPKGYHPLWSNNLGANKFAAAVAHATRKYADTFRESFNPSGQITSRLLGLAAQATYTMWRASFSGLRIGLHRVDPVPGQRDTYKVTAILQNFTDETAQNVSVDMVIGNQTGSLRRISFNGVPSLAPTKTSSRLITADRVHLPYPNERAILRVAGTFTKTPDSGQSQSVANIRGHMTQQSDQKCKRYEDEIAAACLGKNISRARTLMQEAERAGCRIPTEIYRACESSPPGASRQWLVWHECGAKGGWWCRLNLEETTAQRLEQKMERRKKKVVMLGQYKTKHEAIKKTCGMIDIGRIWRGGQFAACPQLGNVNGGVFCVGEFVKSSGSGYVCKE